MELKCVVIVCLIVRATCRHRFVTPPRRLPYVFIMNGSIRRTVCQLLIAAILFAQMMVSAYACPSLLKSGVEGAPVAATDSMPMDCDQMGRMLDPAAPALCSAHCHNHEQSADHADAPMLPHALFTALYWLVVTEANEPLSVVTPDASVLHAALPPPHAILHCCFRI